MKNINDNISSISGTNDVESALKKTYNQALENKDFKEFLDKLKASDNVLYKYTLKLEKSFDEYKNCKKCKSIHECRNEVTGFAYKPNVNNKRVDFYYGACRFTKKINKETKHLKNVYFLDVAKEIQEASMKNIYKNDKKRFDVVSWLSEFIDNYQKDPYQKGLYLSGSFGTGKTYLVSAMLNKLAESNVKSAVIYWPEFLRDLKGSFGTDFNSKFRYIKIVPILLIDDIGAETTTPWSRDEILGPILQHRMQAKLPTFFTSNLNIEQLEKHLSVTRDSVDIVKAKRIVERINQLTENKELLTKNLRK